VDLALSADEFRTFVWPRLPSSRSGVGLPVDYAWSDLHMKSVYSLDATLGAVGGQALELRQIQFAGETTDYGAFRVHRKSVLDVLTVSGERQRIRLFGSLIETEGRTKVFSYVVD
jgi:hypothetical protein